MPSDERHDALFPKLSDAQIEELTPYGEDVTLAPGDTLFAEGDTEQDFCVILEGQIKVTKQVAGEETTLTIHSPGEFTGALSMLTGGLSIATARALVPSKLIRIDLEGFKKLLVERPALAGEILSAMALRRPEADALTQQREKLAALGKMSAGLAHELNNPAAAARSAVGQLRETLSLLQALALQLGDHRLSPEQRGALGKWGSDAALREAAIPPSDPLARSDRESEIADWLEAHHVPNGWELAPTLADAGLDTAQLDSLADQIAPSALADALQWQAATLSVASLLQQVEGSVSRIADLVKAIKAYSYMDQAPLQEIDIRDGLESTITLMAHKLKKGIEVIREYDAALPRIQAYGSELNQVWTNLLDNAADAMGGKGQIHIRTALENDEVLVEIADNGPGIPPEDQTRVFDPFFTTKPAGEGTGLGLDTSYRIVVTRHGGDLRVVSQPGETRFQVRLPLKTPSNSQQ